jgi:hypothetical protein
MGVPLLSMQGGSGAPWLARGCEDLPRNWSPRTIRRWGRFCSAFRIAACHFPVRPVLFCLQDRRLPLPWQALEGVGIEERLVELSGLKVAQFAERWVGDDLPGAAAQRGARHRWSLDPAVLFGRCGSFGGPPLET